MQLKKSVSMFVFLPKRPSIVLRGVATLGRCWEGAEADATATACNFSVLGTISSTSSPSFDSEMEWNINNKYCRLSDKNCFPLPGPVTD